MVCLSGFGAEGAEGIAKREPADAAGEERLIESNPKQWDLEMRIYGAQANKGNTKARKIGATGPPKRPPGNSPFESGCLRDARQMSCFAQT